MKRLEWREYFMAIAKVTAERSTCDRKHVGAVIVRDNNILSTGYNGSVRGLDHCDDVGHMMEDNHCVRVVHAEANAIVQAAKHGVCIEGSDIYVTASPCWPCFKLIANAGIKRVFYGEFYRDSRTLDLAKQAGIAMIHIGLEPESDSREEVDVRPNPRLDTQLDSLAAHDETKSSQKEPIEEIPSSTGDIAMIDLNKPYAIVDANGEFTQYQNIYDIRDQLHCDALAYCEKKDAVFLHKVTYESTYEESTGENIIIVICELLTPKQILRVSSIAKAWSCMRPFIFSMEIRPVPSSKVPLFKCRNAKIKDNFVNRVREELELVNTMILNQKRSSGDVEFRIPSKDTLKKLIDKLPSNTKETTGYKPNLKSWMYISRGYETPVNTYEHYALVGVDGRYIQHPSLGALNDHLQCDTCLYCAKNQAIWLYKCPNEDIVIGTYGPVTPDQILRVSSMVETLFSKYPFNFFMEINTGTLIKTRKVKVVDECVLTVGKALMSVNAECYDHSIEDHEKLPSDTNQAECKSDHKTWPYVHESYVIVGADNKCLQAQNYKAISDLVQCDAYRYCTEHKAVLVHKRSNEDIMISTYGLMAPGQIFRVSFVAQALSTTYPFSIFVKIQTGTSHKSRTVKAVDECAATVYRVLTEINIKDYGYCHDHEKSSSDTMDKTQCDQAFKEYYMSRFGEMSAPFGEMRAPKAQVVQPIPALP